MLYVSPFNSEILFKLNTSISLFLFTLEERTVRVVRTIPIGLNNEFSASLIGTYGTRSPCVRTLNSDVEQKVKEMIRSRSGAEKEQSKGDGEEVQREGDH